jgi:hypothetical protein
VSVANRGQTRVASQELRSPGGLLTPAGLEEGDEGLLQACTQAGGTAGGGVKQAMRLTSTVCDVRPRLR